jgi:hypothetical protein
MGLTLLESYQFGNRIAKIYQIREGQYLLEFCLDGRTSNKLTLGSLEEAKKVAENYTSGSNSQLLNENA